MPVLVYDLYPKKITHKIGRSLTKEQGGGLGKGL